MTKFSAMKKVPNVNKTDYIFINVKLISKSRKWNGNSRKNYIRWSVYMFFSSELFKRKEYLNVPEWINHDARHGWTCIRWYSACMAFFFLMTSFQNILTNRSRTAKLTFAIQFDVGWHQFEGIWQTAFKLVLMFCRQKYSNCIMLWKCPFTRMNVNIF